MNSWFYFSDDPKNRGTKLACLSGATFSKGFTKLQHTS